MDITITEDTLINIVLVIVMIGFAIQAALYARWASNYKLVFTAISLLAGAVLVYRLSTP